MFETLTQYVAAGLSAIPCRKATKRPLLPAWKVYQHRPPDPAELRAWATLPADAVAIIGGPVSGGLEVLDFDAPALFAPWQAEIRATAPHLATLPLARTPSGGYHLYFRSPAPEGNRKLAVSAQRQTLIETRGAGGYALTVPTAGYHLLRGSLTAIPEVTPADRSWLLDTARAFTQQPEVPLSRPLRRSRATGDRPGDEFNARGDPRPFLERAGWRCVRHSGNVEYWRRPGKNVSWSATLNALTGLPNYLYVFSSNAWPFEPGRAYSPFAVYALLHHEGNFHRAAQTLYAQGYGARR